MTAFPSDADSSSSPQSSLPSSAPAPLPSSAPAPLPSSAPAPLLAARGVAKSFGGITALDSVSLELVPGEAVGLVGPNGAGKTTLFDCLLGVTRPDAGTVELDGADITRFPIHRRARLGMGRTFQRMELFTSMTVREHLVVADRARAGTGRLWKDLLNRAKPARAELARVAGMLDLLGLGDVANAPVDSLSMGRGRLVELGRALIGEPRILLLDEPSSGLDSNKTDSLVDTLTTLRRARDMTILLVEHDLEVVVELCERLYVLDFGKLIAEGPTAGVLEDTGVRKAYLGDEVEGPAGGSDG